MTFGMKIYLQTLLYETRFETLRYKFNCGGNMEKPNSMATKYENFLNEATLRFFHFAALNLT